MNILHITELYESGGAYRIVEQLDEKLNKDNFNSFVMCGFNKENKMIKTNHKMLINNNVFAEFYLKYKEILDNNNLVDLAMLFKILIFIKKKNIGILHLHALQNHYIGTADIKFLTKVIPCIWTLHDTWAFTGGCMHYGDCNQWVMGNCKNCKLQIKPSKLEEKNLEIKRKQFVGSHIYFIAPSKWMQNNIMKSIYANENNKLIYNGVDTKCFYPKDKNDLRRKYNLDKVDNYIMFCASDIDSNFKGYNYLIKSLKLLKNPNKYLVLVVGNGKLCKVNDMKIKNFGFVDDRSKLNDIYNMADIFILPSMQDNFPCVTLEAMAAGTPVVAFKTGGILEQFTEEEGWFTQNKTAIDLAMKIEEVFENRELINIKAEKAIKRCHKYFSEELMYKKYVNVYKKQMYNFKGKKNG